MLGVMYTYSRATTFAAIALLIPVFALMALEGGLRLIGFGGDHPLFVRAAGIDGYMQPNREIVHRYFSHPEAAPRVSPDTMYFRAEKPAESTRIVIMGASTAAGFPLGRFASLSGMLGQRFKRLYPDHDIEFISVALSAVNSYALLDFTDEVLDVDPDLVLIYAGHNEFLGIMGVASTFSGGGARWLQIAQLELKHLRLFQLMRRLVAPAQRESESTVGKTLMARVAAGKAISRSSPDFDRGVAQFSANLAAILDRFADAGVPVVLGTLVSNERDQAPLGREGNEDAQQAYASAQGFERQGDLLEARAAYRQARDLDVLRFRAPSAFNVVIRQAAARAGVHLADVESLFRAHSAGGILGKTLFYEHVHPNPRGYFLLAEAFVEAILEAALIAGESTSFPRALAEQEVPLTAVDLRLAELKIERILSGFPFEQDYQQDNEQDKDTQPPHPDRVIEKLAQERLRGGAWVASQQALFSHYAQEGQALAAARVAGVLFDAFPTERRVALTAADLYAAVGDQSLSNYYRTRAHRLAPDS